MTLVSFAVRRLRTAGPSQGAFALAAGLALSFAGFLPADDDQPAPQITFEKFVLDTTFRSEGVAAADFNGDGLMDVAAGSVWYAAPDWKMHVVGEKAMEYNPQGYSNSFCNFAEDLNGDGRPDLIVVDFPGQQTWWFENPGPAADGEASAGGLAARPWKKHVCIDETNNETPLYLDVDGDGRRELICASGDRYIIARPAADPYAKWIITPISASVPQWTGKYYHGLGVGDVNGDGRLDIIIPAGWWEQPEPGVASAGAVEWKFHPAPLGEKCANMHAYDFAGNGRPSIISSSAHAYGIWWHEQTDEGWKTHEIDSSYSQTHALLLADIDGDGLPDFVTGKRWWAHAKGDPGVDEPAVFCWHRLTRKNGRPVWEKHQFDHNSGMGTQFEIVDMNGDGLPDIIASNKRGVHVFLQRRE